MDMKAYKDVFGEDPHRDGVDAAGAASDATGAAVRFGDITDVKKAAADKVACAQCGKSEKLFRCKCEAVRYCGKECVPHPPPYTTASPLTECCACLHCRPDPRTHPAHTPPTGVWNMN